MVNATEKAPKPKQPRASDTTLRHFVGYNVKRTMNMIQSDLAVTLEPFGLRMVTFSALSLVNDNPGLSQSQLAAALAVERPNLVAVVDELAARGLLTRERVPTDRRTYALHLTTAGERQIAEAIQAVHAHEARYLDAVTPQERDLLIKLLNRIERSGTGRP